MVGSHDEEDYYISGWNDCISFIVENLESVPCVNENVLNNMIYGDASFSKTEQEYFSKIENSTKNIYEVDIENNPYLNDYGKYAIQFARNHGITVAETYTHPTVKAYRKNLRVIIQVINSKIFLRVLCDIEHEKLL